MLWSDYKGVIRGLLKDTAAVNWSDEELMTYANWGLVDLARVAGPAKSALLQTSRETRFMTLFEDEKDSGYIVPPSTLPPDGTVTSGTTTVTEYVFGLPADFHDMLAVYRLDDDIRIRVEKFDPFSGNDEWGYILHYPEQGKIYVPQATAVEIWYRSYFDEIVSNSSYLEFAERWLYQALACYIAYVAHLREGVGRAQLEQWAQRPDLQVGNPFNVQAAEWLRAYQRLITDHRVR